MNKKSLIIFEVFLILLLSIGVSKAICKTDKDCGECQKCINKVCVSTCDRSICRTTCSGVYRVNCCNECVNNVCSQTDCGNTGCSKSCGAQCEKDSDCGANYICSNDCSFIIKMLKKK
ncbi:MAG: hypothetical protein QXZ43_03875 [Candidatus Aenigmatarchaeota archaeon]